MQLERIYQLDFKVNADGSIDLEQPSGFGEVDRITLHACQVRLLFERAGHLLPPPPADELAKRLARQLCELRLELCDEYGRSPSLNEAITMLGAVCDSLPDSVFPFDLYPDDAPEVTNRTPEMDRPGFELSMQEARHTAKVRRTQPKEDATCSTYRTKR